MTYRTTVARRVLSLVVALVAVSALAALGAVSLAGGATTSRAAQYQYAPGKVTICHKGKVTIRVSENALPAHRTHGDVVGTCASVAAKAKATKAAAAKAKAAKAKAANAKANGRSATDAPQDAANGHGNGNKGNNGNGKAKGKS